AQCEINRTASSFIPTTTVGVERTADVVSTTTMGWHDQLTGTYYAEYTTKVTTGLQTVLASPFSSGDDTPMAGSFYTNAALAYLLVKDASATIADVSVAFNNDGTTNRQSGAYSLNDFQGYVNGVASAHDTAGTLPNTVHGYFAVGDGAGLGILTGHVQEVRFYDVRKIDTFLDDLSNGLITEEAGGVNPLIIYIGI
ncbi:hypothetical protein LCGC14_2868700, partial [marine sediment metagenome]